VLRLASHIATSTDDLCFVDLQLEGVGRTAQRGQEQISAIGDLALADTTEPFIANRHDFKLFCFAIPRRLLPKGLLDRPRLNLSTTRGLGGYAELCLSGCQLAKASAPIGAHVIDLISHGPANGLILEFSLDPNPDRSRGCCVIAEYRGRRITTQALSQLRQSHA